jgi:hypothetical protein
LTSRDRKQACLHQLVATPAPRPEDIARQVARYLHPTMQLVVVPIVALLVGSGVGLVLGLVVERVLYPNRLNPSGNAVGITELVCIAATVAFAIWSLARKRRSLTMLARDGSVAELERGPSKGGALAALAQAVGSSDVWYVDIGATRFTVSSWSASMVEVRLSTTSRLLVHPRMPIAALIEGDCNRIALVRVKRAAR